MPPLRQPKDRAPRHRTAPAAPRLGRGALRHYACFVAFTFVLFAGFAFIFFSEAMTSAKSSDAEVVDTAGVALTVDSPLLGRPRARFTTGIAISFAGAGVLAVIGIFTFGTDAAFTTGVDTTFVLGAASASTLARRLGQHPLASTWTRRADELTALISSLCWDTRDQFFYTQDVQCGDHRAKLIPWAAPGMPMDWQSLHIRIQSFTGFLPLWCGAATPAQADAMLGHALNPDTFHSAFGIRSLARNEPMFSLAQSNNPSNWPGPIWIVANYFVWSGLRRYGFASEATDLARRTLDLLERDLRKNGALHEYYHPDTGAPLMNKGFLS